MPDAPVTLPAEATVRGLVGIWKRRSPVDISPAHAGTIRRPLVERVLDARGLAPGPDRDAFLDPSLKHLHDPSCIPDLDRAAARLLDAARSAERIAIYGDYDVDGITASAILWHTLRTIAPGCDIITYVPHRLEEGYGLSVDAISELASRGVKVIVSVDCGVTAVAPAARARELGIDLLITDHHNPPATVAELPDAFAVVHPGRPDSSYPFKMLAGAGVAYKLAWRLCTMACGASRVREDLRELLVDLLALASLGTVADVVPLVGENRVLCRFGLARIRHSRFAGLNALVSASGLDGEKVQAEDVGFKLGPRLNACGRMGHAREAVELLTTADGARAREIAEQLCRLNDQRRATEREIFERAAAMAEAAGMHRDDTRAIVLAHESWHAGVVGIVCSRLVERFHRPTILLAMHDGECHGSGRSIEGFQLADALSRCAALLKSHGGHDMAAGLKLDASRLAEFTGHFVSIANAQIDPARLVGTVSFDTDAQFDELTAENVRSLDKLAPFGQANPAPRIRLRGLRLAEHPQAFGAGAKHAGLRVKSAASGRTLRMVGWNLAARLAGLRSGAAIDAIVAPRVSAWSGQVEPEIHDVRSADL